MTSILIGCITFALIAIYDWAQMHKFTWLKPVFLLSAVTLCIGIVGVLSVPAEFKFTIWLRIVAWIGLAIFLSLLLYSVLIEIPLRNKSSHLNPDNNRILIDTGTYALTRHPGVLWFAGTAICMILLHPSRLTLAAGVIWTVLNILLVWIEDSHFFPFVFSGYLHYKKRTPFLWPNRKSLQRCILTVGLKKSHPE